MVDMDREWGVSFSMDVKGCNPAIVSSKEKIQEFIIALCKQHNIERHQDCAFVTLINGDTVLLQMLDIGMMTGLFGFMQNNFHLTICSTENFDISLMQQQTRDFFSAEEITTHYSIRY